MECVNVLMEGVNAPDWGPPSLHCAYGNLMLMLTRGVHGPRLRALLEGFTGELA
jgi:hypothetical protein